MKIQNKIFYEQIFSSDYTIMDYPPERKYKLQTKSKQSEEFTYNPPKKLTTFYQICHYKNAFSNKYGVRKIIFNELGTIIKTYDKEYSRGAVESFMKNNRKNKYTMYPTPDLKTIALPGPSFIFEAQSELLNNNFEGNYYLI